MVNRLRSKAALFIAFVLLWTSLGFPPHTVQNAQAANAEAVMFEDHFEDGDLTGWTTLAGSAWNVSSGELVFGDPGSEAIITAGDPMWTDYSFESRVKIGTGYPGLAARMQDKDNFYLFRYDPAKKGVDLAVRKNGTDTLLQEASFNPANGSWVTFKIVVKGNIIQGFVDGHKLIEVYDDTFRSGAVGFRSRWAPFAADDIIVRDARRLHTDFEDRTLNPWTPITGEWSVVDNVYRSVSDSVYDQALSQNLSGQPGLAAAGDSSWDSYYIEADATPLTAEAEFGLAGRVQDASNFYLLRWSGKNGGHLELVRREHDAEQVLKTASYPMTAGQSYSLRLELTGSRLTGYVNKSKVVEVSDNSWSSGAAGLWSTGSAYFDNTVSAVMKDPAQAETLAHWKFQPDYIQSGSLDAGDLVLSDLTQRGNDLRLVTIGDAAHPDTASVLQWSEDDYHGSPGVKSLLFNNTQTGPVKRYFETVPTAPVNDEQFAHGYTIEVIYKLPAEFSRNTHSWMKILNRQGTGALAGKTQGETDLLGQLAVSNLKELQWTYYSTALASNPTSWSFSLDSVEDWYHIVLVNDTKNTKIYVNGVTDFRNATQTISNFAGIVGKGWDIGAASQGEGVGAKRFLAGNLEEMRIVNRPLPVDQWLIPNSLDRTPEYGNNENLPLLQEPDNYNIVLVPDIQKPIRYMPEIVEEQTKWLTRHAQANNVVFTAFLGDIVDQYNVTDEWLASNKAITYLDYAELPYMTIAGNHDYAYTGGSEPYLTYFGKKRYADKPYYTNESPSGYSSYSLFKAGSYEYMIIGSDWRDDHYNADRAWIQKVLSEHKTIPTILISHEILEFQGEQSTEVQHSWRGTRNWNDFVKNNDQIFMTVSGHHHGAGYMVSKNAFGHDVLEVLVDYQSQYHGGNGWMRFAEFDESGNQIHFHTFSPWVAAMPDNERTYFDMKNLIGSKDRFTYPINFTERFAFSQPLYYVDSGSTDTDWLPPGEKFGLSNSQTDQPFGADPVTGKQWGYTADGAAQASGGTDPWTSVLSDNGGTGKGLTYTFEAPAGTYEVVTGFRSPVNDTGRKQSVILNGDTKLTAYTPPSHTNEEYLFETAAQDGQIKLEIKRDASSISDPIISWVKIIRKNVPVQEIQLDMPNVTLEVGKTYNYGITVLPAEATETDLIWSSSDEAIVMVKDGTIVARQAGTAIVTVTAKDGTAAASSSVTVQLPPANKAELAKQIADALTLDAALYTSDSWSILLSALDSATALYDNPDTGQEQLDQAAEQLHMAIEQLVTLSSVTPSWPAGSALLKTDVTQNEVELSWFAANNASQYKILMSTGAEALFKPVEAQITSVTQSVYAAKITGLASGTAYTFKVEAGNRYEAWTTDGPQLDIKTPVPSYTGGGGGGTPGTGGNSGTIGGSQAAPGNSLTPSITKEQLTSGKAGLVAVEMTGSQITLPAQAAQLLQNSRLQVSTEDLTLSIPSSVFQSLYDKAGNKAGQGLMTVHVEQLQLTEEQLHAANPSVELAQAGQAYVIDVYWTDQQNPVKLDSFPDSIRITSTIRQASVQASLAGYYYRNSANMQWEYVNSTLSRENGLLTSELTRPGTIAVLEWNQLFEDVPANHWASNSVRIMAAHHLVEGISNTQFAPDRLVTRAELVTLLARLLKLPTKPELSNPFTDVSDSAWYTEALTAAQHYGIATGSSSGKFEPGRPVTRQEMAELLVRAYEFRNGEISSTSDHAKVYKDQGNISAWARSGVNKAVQQGLMKGQSAAKFAPEGLSTRAEMAQAVFNLADKLNGTQ
ncbi:S-layer homology domain-containing protein [Paenibacillus tarimensis]|uniref:S-layer homology domain-containing protein n=1 Tax=Paenibacillus tarimensis TaxID=416012 RepID=UPI001F286042|nr:S-layer homology domain-containing protein [Paenibacillus tarimensis]MCF2943694.1 S-layer homology domain-containing protein [Paenibacillus tarimensis]